MKKEVFVSVPASSGNLGVGFDVLGLALNLRNELYVRVRRNPKFAAPLVVVKKEGNNSLPTNSRNTIYRVIESVFRKFRRAVPALEIICVNRIPLARGLGSSSAAYLSALLAANRLLGDPLGRDQILDWATALEGHPDNVAPALYGGVRASGVFDGRVLSAAWPVPKANVVVAIPAFELSTKKARKVLPTRLSLKDAIFNLASVSLLRTALTEEPEWLGRLLNDRWHEPYRARLIPGFYQVKKAALKAGAYGVTLSGAGPTMLAFVKPNGADQVSRAMQQAFLKVRVQSSVKKLRVDHEGAFVK